MTVKHLIDELLALPPVMSIQLSNFRHCLLFPTLILSSIYFILLYFTLFAGTDDTTGTGTGSGVVHPLPCSPSALSQTLHSLCTSFGQVPFPRSFPQKFAIISSNHIRLFFHHLNRI